MQELHARSIASRVSRGVRTAGARVVFEAGGAFGKHLRWQRYRFGNGLRVVALEDHSAPVVSYQTWFGVGSRHETPGKTGLAHLFEHLMFNETKNLAPGEFDRMLEQAGGETNAATWTDWTYYYENVPKESLELVIRLEADRMSNLVLRIPQVRSEKEVVANERRMRVDDDVEGAASERLYALAFRKHPYQWPTIGWMKDIEGFTTSDCRAFYKRFYAPNNAALIVAGDFDTEALLASIQAGYGRLRASRLPQVEAVTEPPQRAERKVDMTWPTATEKLHVGYRACAFGSKDWATLAVAHEILAGGRSSRLYRSLVDDKELAAEVHGALSPFRDPGLYELWLSIRPGHRAEEALKVVEEELRNLSERSIEQAELEKAKNRLELALVESMETAGGKATEIGFHETVLGDPHAVFGRLEAYRAVTPLQLRTCCARYFRNRSRSTVFVRCTDEGEASC